MTVINWDASRTSPLLLRPDTHSNKYSRGVLALRTGSVAYPGAAVLGAQAAWRTGIGLLRFIPQIDDGDAIYGLPTPAAAVLALRPETVFGAGPDNAAHCDAWVIGSGTDPARRSLAETHAIVQLLAGSTPVILDAGALTTLTHAPLAPTLITPHRGEFLTLWRESQCGGVQPEGWSDDHGSAPATEALIAAASRLATHLGVTVLLKGSTTVTATPAGFVALSGPATPWLATAGTGDVLAGILGALVTSHSAATMTDPELLGPLGASAALIHDAAARIASGPGELRPITANDVAEAIPAAVAAISALK